jgi:hypothetical protein
MPDDKLTSKEIQALVTSYGPAQSRHTKTPVRFADLGKDQEGQYDPPSPGAIIKILLSNPAILKEAGKGVITLNPNAQDFDLEKVSKHEQMHANMNEIPSKWYQASGTGGRELAQSIPGYQQIAEQLALRRGGEMPNEVPAYAATNNPDQTGIPQNWMDEYTDKLKNVISKNFPQLAQMIGVLSQ